MPSPRQAATIPPMSAFRRELPVIIVNAIYITFFTFVALGNANYEFVLYAGVVIVLFGWILYKQAVVQFDRTILWGLTAWGLMHMAGGNVRINGEILYGLQLIPVVLRYDEFVHAFGFGVGTLVCFHLLRPYLRNDTEKWWPLAILVVLMGLGLGALNELVEFVAVLTIPETNVGGYENTLWDLVFDLIGAVLAVILLTYRRAQAGRGIALDT